MSLKTFAHGIHPRENKEITALKPIRRFPFPPYFVLLLSQHAGKPAKPIVREGQEVCRGELIAVANGFVSVPIHSPATGVVKKVGTSLDFNGKMAPAIIIIPYPGSLQQVECWQSRDIDHMTPKEIIQGVQDMGMVGLGGAAFPTHVKLTPPKGKTIETLIINGCECEPYLTSDHRVMLEQSDDIMIGIRLLLKGVMAQRAVIAIEANKPDAIELMKKCSEGEKQISVAVFQTKYPQGAEKMLTRALMKKDIPSGGLPADIGCVISNVATVAEIGRLLPRGQGLIERVVTISGRGVQRPGNYFIPIGTPLDFILDQVGLEGRAHQVIFGGPMMGKGVAFLETPITKGISGIVVMADAEHKSRQKIYPCIKCAECVNSCPIHLNPSTLGLLARKDEFDQMAEDFHLFDCFECGCCSYVCPSHIPLVQYFRLAKEAVRKKRSAA